jgi:hypothetical protein
VQIIVFTLSKRQCEDLAGQLSSVQLNSSDESALVDRIFWSAMDILSADDRRLPQICNALPMLKRGIGVHHSGLLPIVKEVIEVLFGEGLVKVGACLLPWWPSPFFASFKPCLLSLALWSGFVSVSPELRIPSPRGQCAC